MYYREEWGDIGILLERWCRGFFYGGAFLRVFYLGGWRGFCWGEVFLVVLGGDGVTWVLVGLGVRFRYFMIIVCFCRFLFRMCCLRRMWFRLLEMLFVFFGSCSVWFFEVVMIFGFILFFCIYTVRFLIIRYYILRYCVFFCCFIRISVRCFLW